MVTKSVVCKGMSKPQNQTVEVVLKCILIEKSRNATYRKENQQQGSGSGVEQ